jgi:serine/threonine protein kinase
MSDLTGKTLSQYQIVERLQDTGSALIYKGFQPNMNRYVLVEVLKSHDPAAVQAFNQQSELLAQIQHPNILPIYDSGQAEGLNYRAMRYAEGGVLPDHLLPYYDPGEAAGFLSGVVAGLVQIHAHGWVHGNLAPENIYLDENGQPLLTDFGIPRPAGAPVTSYLSPEQVQGDIVDQRSDIYALGVLLYTLLIGETPPAGVVVSPRAKRPDLPASRNNRSASCCDRSTSCCDRSTSCCDRSARCCGRRRFDLRDRTWGGESILWLGAANCRR